MNKRLPHLIQGRIVQVLRLESCKINQLIAGVITLNDVLLCQLHAPTLLAPSFDRIYDHHRMTGQRPT